MMLALAALLSTLAASSPPAVLVPSNSTTDVAPKEAPTLHDLVLLVQTLQKEKAESAARIAALEERVSAMERRASISTTSSGYNVALLSARTGASGGMSSAVALNKGEPTHAIRVKGWRVRDAQRAHTRNELRPPLPPLYRNRQIHRRRFIRPPLRKVSSVNIRIRLHVPRDLRRMWLGGLNADDVCEVRLLSDYEVPGAKFTTLFRPNLPAESLSAAASPFHVRVTQRAHSRVTTTSCRTLAP